MIESTPRRERTFKLTKSESIEILGPQTFLSLQGERRKLSTFLRENAELLDIDKNTTPFTLLNAEKNTVGFIENDTLFKIKGEDTQPIATYIRSEKDSIYSSSDLSEQLAIIKDLNAGTVKVLPNEKASTPFIAVIYERDSGRINKLWYFKDSHDSSQQSLGKDNSTSPLNTSPSTKKSFPEKDSAISEASNSSSKATIPTGASENIQPTETSRKTPELKTELEDGEKSKVTTEDSLPRCPTQITASTTLTVERYDRAKSKEEELSMCQDQCNLSRTSILECPKNCQVASSQSTASRAVQKFYAAGSCEVVATCTKRGLKVSEITVDQIYDTNLRVLHSTTECDTSTKEKITEIGRSVCLNPSTYSARNLKALYAKGKKYCPRGTQVSLSSRLAVLKSSDCNWSQTECQCDILTSCQ